MLVSSATLGPVKNETDGNGVSRIGAPPESIAARLKRWTLSAAFDLKPPRHRLAPRLAARMIAHLLAGKDVRNTLPDPAWALPGREGIAGFCDDMSVATLRAAYAQGLFPCTHAGPMRWLCPPLRSVLDVREFKIRDELRRKLKKRVFTVTFDREPIAVMKACAAPRPGQWPLTWITPDVIEAYEALHRAGDMHTLEVWDKNGELVGGLFGTVVGSCFVVESLFHTVANSSKYGLAVLIAHLQTWGFTHVDNKLQNPHVEALGFAEIPREEYRRILSASAPAPAGGEWKVDEGLDLGQWVPHAGPPAPGRRGGK